MLPSVIAATVRQVSSPSNEVLHPVTKQIFSSLLLSDVHEKSGWARFWHEIEKSQDSSHAKKWILHNFSPVSGQC
jgi:hypothetical protein